MAQPPNNTGNPVAPAAPAPSAAPPTSSLTPTGGARIPPPSHRDLAPLEEGGRIARDGFDYQDHVAVDKCLDMLGGDGPVEVWCEAEDDLVCVWHANGAEEFEFIQVKGHDLKQAWTVSKLCWRETGKDDKKKLSIVERSLAHDRGAEPCRFRIVTTWSPDEVLDVLLVALTVRTEPKIAARLEAAVVAIEQYLGEVQSANKHGVAFWVTRTQWEHRASTRDVRNGNLVKLTRILSGAGRYLAPDQCDELHAALYAKVQDASLASGLTEKSAKRLLREPLRAWLLERARQIQHPTHTGDSGPLVGKLKDATGDPGAIEVAKELRRAYTSEVRTPRYMPAEDREPLETELLAVLHRLKTQLDAGELDDDPAQFLSRCQAALRDARDKIGDGHTRDALLYGYMYEIMNRCLHRLKRVSP